ATAIRVEGVADAFVAVSSDPGGCGCVHSRPGMMTRVCRVLLCPPNEIASIRRLLEKRFGSRPLASLFVLVRIWVRPPA
ncbi:hypothetical protein CSUI_009339, partial [Cystoisospora suis]